MSRSYQEVTPAAGTYPVTPQVILGFVPDEVRFTAVSAAGNDAAYSFDGVNDHGKILGGAPVDWFVPERIKAQKVWLRILLGAPIVGVAGKTDI